MRIFISVDLEGIGGVVHWNQTAPGDRQYDETRALMTAEANAAISGAFDCGATEVLVNDAHGSMRNISAPDLDRRARLVTGNTKPLSMMQGIDESFDAAFFVGYHAGAGCHGVLAHTYDGFAAGVRLNSQLAGEAVINAALAGYYGVPVALVTGDAAVCREALSVLGPVETVAVKEPITRFSADCLSPLVVRERIRAAASAALGRISELEPFTLEPPIRLELAFTHAGYADRASLMPGVDRIDAVTVAYQSEDFMMTYRAFLTMLVLAGSVG